MSFWVQRTGETGERVLMRVCVGTSELSDIESIVRRGHFTCLVSQPVECNDPLCIPHTNLSDEDLYFQQSDMASPSLCHTTF